MLPPTACFVKRRFSVPEVHRTPIPNGTPVGWLWLHSPTKERDMGRSPVVVNTRLSDEREAAPAALRVAPPVPAEFSHPRPGPDGGFAHGHPITPPDPG